MLDAKIHINSTAISDAHKGARHLGLDIMKNYLGTPTDYFQYIHVPTSVISQEVWDGPSYDTEVASDRYVYLEIRRDMYGLTVEAGIIAFNQLVKKPAPRGYAPMSFTPGLWRHQTRRNTFVLCFNDFSVKYFSKAVT